MNRQAKRGWKYPGRTKQIVSEEIALAAADPHEDELKYWH